jgi:hypothetical protein
MGGGWDGGVIRYGLDTFGPVVVVAALGLASMAFCALFVHHVRKWR